MIKQCRHCGGGFEVDESNQYEKRKEYCSDICRSRARHKRKKDGPTGYEKVCQECGKAYVAKRCDSVTCSPECNTERNKRRVRENGAFYRAKYRAERMLQKEKEKQKPKNKADTLAEFDRKARAMGLSYGQYDLYLRMQKGALE